MTRTLLLALATACALVMAGAAGAANAAGLLIIHHKVADYARWRPVFDRDRANLQAAGLTNGRVYRSTDDPNDVTVVLDMADAAKAKAYTQSDKLRQTMIGAGVQGQPEALFLDPAP